VNTISTVTDTIYTTISPDFTVPVLLELLQHSSWCPTKFD